MLDLAALLLNATEEMLSYAKTEQWDEVETLQQRRTQLLKQLETAMAAQAIKPATSQALNRQLSRCKVLEQQCRELAKKHHTTLATERQKVLKGKAMQKAYGGQTKG
ncbi:MAG: flagellar protein FliT [Pontibacterium sp.]